MRLKPAALRCPLAGLYFCGVYFSPTGLNVSGPRAHGVYFFSVNISLPTASPGHTHTLLMQCIHPGQYKE